VAQPHLAPVVDLMEALKKSLAAGQPAKGAKPAPAAAAEQHPAAAAAPGPRVVPAPPKKARKKLAS
jgi:hypothetical protein